MKAQDGRIGSLGLVDCQSRTRIGKIYGNGCKCLVDLRSLIDEWDDHSNQNPCSSAINSWTILAFAVEQPTDKIFDVMEFIIEEHRHDVGNVRYGSFRQLTG